ncbi:MAG: beta-lactamase family protein [Proteobacteria bacterium]|nr:beta-lactamase family protein [Pseudomonadota bacterium]
MSRLRDIVDAARGDVPCAVVLAGPDGEEAWAAGEPVDEPQFIGSVTKVVVATAVVRLAHLGYLDLDDRTRALLAHRVGGSFAYSGAGYEELGRLVADAATLPLPMAIHDHVLMPWSLVRSGFPTRALRPPELPETAFAAGGLRSTARELARFGLRHLSDPIYAVMQERQGDAGALADGMGLGWMIDDFDGTKVLRHGGHVADRSAILAAIPSLGTSLAVLCGPEREAGVIWGAVMRERLGLIQP